MQTSSPPARRGVVIGRFMPPHAGHLYLVDFARSYCDRLTVFVCTLPDEPIPGALRFQWMSRLFPDAEIVHITEAIPEARKDEPGSTRIWARTINAHVPDGVSYVFASESYGKELAQELGAEFVAVDPARTLFPVSATDIRNDPMRHWRYIPQAVRPYYLRRICVISDSAVNLERPPNSLARDLARAASTAYVADYGRFWLSRRGNAFGPESIAGLIRAQAASEAAVALQADRLLFAESSALQIAARARLHLGELPPQVLSLMDSFVDSERYDRYLVAGSDDERARPFLDWCVSRLTSSGKSPIVLPSDPGDAFSRAQQATADLTD
jgi:HTH-type transcriptional regulator, transcriptional repressor of NAD biosynthesis genes